MAVRIRMKKLGRRHRPFFRICATDGHAPRDGRVLEELGTYDPMVPDTDARAVLNSERIDYWLSVGAQPSDKVKTLIKKYGTDGTHVAQQQAARERLAQPKSLPDAGEPTFVVKPAEEPKAEEAKAEEPKAEEPKAEEPKAEEPKAEEPKAEEAKAEEPAAEAAAEPAAAEKEAAAGDAEPKATEEEPKKPAE